MAFRSPKLGPRFLCCKEAELCHPIPVQVSHAI